MKNLFGLKEILPYLETSEGWQEKEHLAIENLLQPNLSSPCKQRKVDFIKKLHFIVHVCVLAHVCLCWLTTALTFIKIATYAGWNGQIPVNKHSLTSLLQSYVK